MSSEKRAQKFHTDYPDLGSASDWLNQISQTARPIRSTTQIWAVTRHQYGISALVSQASLGGETSADRLQMWAVFSGYVPLFLAFQHRNFPQKLLCFR